MSSPVYTMRGVQAYKNRRNLAFEQALDRHDRAIKSFGDNLNDTKLLLDRSRPLIVDQYFDRTRTWTRLGLVLMLTGALGYAVGLVLR